jgi:hypothetical protein
MRTFRVELPFRPLLASWEQREHRAQMALTEYRAALAELASPAVAALQPPLALKFHVAGREAIARGCDFDNFLTPVVEALGGPGQFTFVSATRGRARERSRPTLSTAAAATDDFEPADYAWRLL